MRFPEFLLERVRQPPPRACGHVVVGRSTPVVSFGDCLTARVATLSLNPSEDEFLDKNKRLWSGGSRRLATLESLGVATLDGCSDEVAEQVVRDCFAYFGPKANPYGAWFTRISNFVESITGTSYRQGTACHLDIVQWATDPAWAELDQDVRARLAESDRAFLSQQLALPNIQIVLVNGRTALEHLESMGVKFNVTRINPIEKKKHAEVFLGSTGDTLICGWNFALAQPPEKKVLQAVQELIRGEVERRQFA